MISKQVVSLGGMLVCARRTVRLYFDCLETDVLVEVQFDDGELVVFVALDFRLRGRPF